jgi:cephalosporin-C deacetylase-like acetyl esterase
MKAPVLALVTVSIALGADLRVVPGDELRTEFADYLTANAQAHIRARAAEVAGLDTPAKVRARQAFIRKWLIDAMGGFPEKTPLNPRITGRLQRDGYRIELLVFESMPKFYVTANVYVPTGAPGPFPAIVGTAGHSVTGKAIGTYQQAWIGLVKRGFVVLAFDPPGQGERLEYFDPKLKRSTVGVGTTEHNMAGLQCLLTGTTFARYETWDGIRALDYLLTRADVDPKRIGVAGNSGGGTQSAYLAAVEPRLAASAISCYMTNWEQLWATPGPQDAEQNFPGFLSAGLNFGDFMIAFAPRPVMMLTGTRDYFPIAGGHATYAEVKRVFGVMDAEVRAGFFEHDSEHGWNQPRREATTRWMMKWLQGKDDEAREAASQPEPELLLNATPTGQVATSLGGETVRSINAALARSLFAKRTAAGISDPEKLRALIARTLNLPPRSLPPSAEEKGSVTEDGLHASKFLIGTEPGVRIPALLWGSASSPGKRPAVLYINPKGKMADPGAIRKLVDAGKLVLSIDPRGWGESAPPPRTRDYSAEWQMAQRALLIGKPLAAMQTFDVLRAFDWFLTLPEVDASRIGVVGTGAGGVVALFAAAVEPRIASAEVSDTLESYLRLAEADTHTMPIGLVIPGVLKQFDLPDVARAIAPRPLRKF